MDDITSNINITCDMLIQIIRNLIILSNTSTNISSAAVTSLLNSVPPSTSSSADTAIIHDLASRNSTLMDQCQSINLNNPLYTNSQLNHYRLRNKSSTSFDTMSVYEQSFATNTNNPSDAESNHPNSTSSNSHNSSRQK